MLLKSLKFDHQIAMLMKAGKILVCLTCSEKSLECPVEKSLLKHIQQWANEHIRKTGHSQFETR